MTSADGRDQLAANLGAVRQRMAAACERAGRAVEEITLIAVTKYAELEWVRGLYDLGLRDFGESRPQQLIARAAEFPDDVRWHLIGHLQRNKSALVLPHVVRIHSVDSVRLIRQLSADALKLDRTASILLEVNVSGEESKDGFDPGELRRVWPELITIPALHYRGLMTMAPLDEAAEAARPVFQRLRELRDELSQRPGAPVLQELSMGMSGDFEIGIEEGATMIRVGSSLFDHLPTAP